jgi:DNA polymerase III delta subunit
MLYILTGPNISKKRSFVKQLAEKEGAQIIHLISFDVDTLNRINTPDLFGKGEVWEVTPEDDMWTEWVDSLAVSKAVVCVIVSSLDARKKSTKVLLETKGVIAQDFPTPTPGILQRYITDILKSKGVTFDATLPLALIQRCGLTEDLEKVPGSVQEVRLLRLQSVLSQLQTYGSTNPLTVEVLDTFIGNLAEVMVYDLVNAIAEKKLASVYSLLDAWLGQTFGDDKPQIIQLTAALSDQLRNIWLVQEWGNRPEAELLAATEWKKGRVFVLRNLSRRFSPAVLRSTLDKLVELDKELKTSDMPPRAMLELILVQAILAKA